MIDALMSKWREEIRANPDYQRALKKTKPGQKKRQEVLAEVVDPYEARVLEDLLGNDVGKDALVSYLKSEEAAYHRAHAFGVDFVLSVEIPLFDKASEKEREVMRYQAACFSLVWNRLYGEMMAPEYHQAR